MKSQFDSIEQRLTKLEIAGPTSASPPAASSAPAAGGWRPGHIVIGGWPEDKGNAWRLEAAENLLARLPEHMRNKHLRPFVPGRSDGDKPGSGIVKFRWGPIASPPRRTLP